MKAKKGEMEKKLNAYSVKVLQNVVPRAGQQPKPKYPEVQVQKAG